MSEKVQFLAAFPAIQSAIKIGEGMRIMLDISETELPKAIALISMRDTVLRVTIERSTKADAVPAHASIEGDATALKQRANKHGL